MTLGPRIDEKLFKVEAYAQLTPSHFRPSSALVDVFIRSISLEEKMSV